MDIREIAPGYAVSPQVAPTDMAELAALGYRTVICNRPDSEVPPDLRAAAIRDAAEAAGLVFVEIPLDTRVSAVDAAAEQASAIADNPGPVIAYCASGTRSTIVWAFGQTARLSPDEIIEAAGRAGYGLEALRPALTPRP